MRRVLVPPPPAPTAPAAPPPELSANATERVERWRKKLAKEMLVHPPPPGFAGARSRRRKRRTRVRDVCK